VELLKFLLAERREAGRRVALVPTGRDWDLLGRGVGTLDKDMRGLRVGDLERASDGLLVGFVGMRVFLVIFLRVTTIVFLGLSFFSFSAAGDAGFSRPLCIRDVGRLGCGVVVLVVSLFWLMRPNAPFSRIFVRASLAAPASATDSEVS